MADGNDLAELIGPVYKTATVADLLAIPVEDVLTARRDGHLLGMQASGGEWVHPAFQFTGRAVDPRGGTRHPCSPRRAPLVSSRLVHPAQP